MSGAIDYAALESAVGKSVSVEHAGQTHALTLVSCTKCDTSKDGEEAKQGRKQEPLSLLLRGEPGLHLRGDSYTLVVEGMAPIEGVLLTRTIEPKSEETIAAEAEGRREDHEAPYFEICLN